LSRGDATTVQRFLGHLRARGIVRPAEVPRDDSAITQLLRLYEVYLKQERGLATVTVANYRPFVHRFLTERFGDGPLLLEALGPSDLETSVVRHAPSTSSKRAQLMVSALRSFLRFLLQQGEIAIDLAASVPTVADTRLATVPKCISAQEVERVLAGCNQSTTVGRRDYAILLLLALGLRAGKCRPQLDDITGIRRVRGQGKGKTRDRLPLPQDVGRALATFADEAEPDRHIFLCARAPPVPSAVIVRQHYRLPALQRVGAPSTRVRTCCATVWPPGCCSGATMAEIAEVLGIAVHRYEIYAGSMSSACVPSPTLARRRGGQ
jgi:site-specific recombinase XerC